MDALARQSWTKDVTGVGNVENLRGRGGGFGACQTLIGCAAYRSAPCSIRGTGSW